MKRNVKTKVRKPISLGTMLTELWNSSETTTYGSTLHRDDKLTRKRGKRKEISTRTIPWHWKIMESTQKHMWHYRPRPCHFTVSRPWLACLIHTQCLLSFSYPITAVSFEPSLGSDVSAEDIVVNRTTFTFNQFTNSSTSTAQYLSTTLIIISSL